MNAAASFWWLFIVVIKIINLADANWITGNLCWSMPCMNGGSCFGSAYTYLCVCPINYNGALCEKRFGICRENPCGNRGLCIETSLTTFECRCYFDYMGPTCKDNISKNNRNIWSSLLPVHTRVLFDMLQEAYRTKAKDKSSVSSGNGQIDFIGLLTTNEPSSLQPPITSTALETTSVTRQSEITETEHVIQAEEIQLEKIFSDFSTAPTVYDFTEQMSPTESNEFDNQTTVSSYPEIDTSLITTMEQNQSVYLNTTDDQAIVNITEQSITSDTIDYSTATIQNEELNNTVQSEEVVSMTADDEKFYSSDPTITSTEQLPSTISQTEHKQLLYKLCKQLLSRILPNGSSAAVESAALSLASDPSSINNTADALLSWISKQLISSTSTTATATVSSFMINEIQASSIPLQRVDLDDVLHRMNENIDGEH